MPAAILTGDRIPKNNETRIWGIHCTGLGEPDTMNEQSNPIHIGNTIQQHPDGKVTGEFVTMLDDTFYKIKNYDGMAPFFMSIVSSSNHWLFISSTGGTVSLLHR